MPLPDQADFYQLAVQQNKPYIAITTMQEFGLNGKVRNGAAITRRRGLTALASQRTSRTQGTGWSLSLARPIL